MFQKQLNVVAKVGGGNCREKFKGCEGKHGGHATRKCVGALGASRLQRIKLGECCMYPDTNADLG